MKFLIKKRTRYFDLDLITLPSIIREDTPEGRYYVTPDGRFPSVTTVLGRNSDKSWLKKWKERVVEDKAKQILTQAGIRGTAIHSLAENYLLNNDDWNKDVMPSNLFTFNQIKPFLDKRVGKVFGSELAVWSKSLQTAGTTDLFAEFDGINSIIDFKTSRGEKKEEDIEHYFIQATCYAMMLEELTSFKIPNIVILITSDYGDCNCFVKDKSQYVERVRNLFS